MLDNLIIMAKQEGMFDIAFLLAEKNNLYNELFNSLKHKHDITFDKLKELVKLKVKEDIEYLDICYNLKQLSCDYKCIKVLDMTNNINLIYLKCYSNGIKKLDISKNVKLTRLLCSFNQITHLDLSNKPNLEYLHCSTNQITYLGITNNVNLKVLNCKSNLINNLDLYKNINLDYLDCRDNPKLKHIKLNKQVEGKIEIYKDDHTVIEYVE